MDILGFPLLDVANDWVYVLFNLIKVCHVDTQNLFWVKRYIHGPLSPELR